MFFKEGYSSEEDQDIHTKEELKESIYERTKNRAELLLKKIKGDNLLEGANKKKSEECDTSQEVNEEYMAEKTNGEELHDAEKDLELERVEEKLIFLNKRSKDAEGIFRRMEIIFESDNSEENNIILKEAERGFQLAYHEYASNVYEAATNLKMKPNELLREINKKRSDVYNIKKQILIEEGKKNTKRGDSSGENLSSKTESIEQEVEESKNSIYEKGRRRADVFLENFEFVKKENIVEINPEQEKDNVPVFFAPGWGVRGDSNSAAEVLKIIASEGRRVVSASFTGEQGIIDNGQKEDIPIAELQKALTIIESINEINLDKVDAIGHSEGGLSLAIAACLYPEKFRNIVFVSPAGMIGGDSCLDLVKRFTIDEGIEELKNRGKQNMNSFYGYTKEIISHVVKNPILSLKEISAMSEIDIFEMTKHLKSHGIGVGLVCGANDKVFPIEDIIDRINDKNVDCFLSTKGDHGSLMFNREHGLLAENLLSNMSKIKKASS